MLSDARLIGIKPIECKVLSLLVRGDSARLIAEKLHISRPYVYFLMRELRLRFGVRTNTGVISQAIAIGLVQPDCTINWAGIEGEGPKQ